MFVFTNFFFCFKDNSTNLTSVLSTATKSFTQKHQLNYVNVFSRKNKMKTKIVLERKNNSGKQLISNTTLAPILNESWSITFASYYFPFKSN